MKKRSKKMAKNYIFLGLALLLIACGALIYGINDRLLYFEKSKSFENAIATVIDYDYDKDRKAAEIIEYTVNENTFVKQLDTYSHNPLDINETLQIKYNPINPDDIIYNDNYFIYLLILIGFIILSISIVIIIENYMIIKFNN